MSDRRTWFEFPDGRDERAWRVVVGTPRSEPDLRGRYGVTDYDARRIAIDYRREALGETMLHEMMHAALDPFDLDIEREHGLITLLSPRLYPMLEHAGLRWPHLPPAARRRR